MKEKLLKLLEDNRNQFVSEQYISECLTVGNVDICKYIDALKEEGCDIESVPEKGYKLLSTTDVLTYEKISSYLNTKYIGREIIYLDSVNSTNVKAKELAANNSVEGTVVIAEEQTQGRGRLGRSWSSPKKQGIWMSVILRPKMKSQDAVKITQVAAAAVWKAINHIGISAKIKWPNDIVINSKKVCGILTEMSGELNRLNYVIVGIGVNVNTDMDSFPEEIRHMATSLMLESNNMVNRKELAALILNYFEELYDEANNYGSFTNSMKICRENSVLLGKTIKLTIKGEEQEVRALDINEEGELIIQDKEGIISKVISGEVSVRGLYGYV